jgi:hypothetical protein
VDALDGHNIYFYVGLHSLANHPKKNSKNVPNIKAMESNYFSK